MRPLGREMIRILSSGQIPFPEPIVELGSYRTEGQEELANLRDFFTNAEYVGCDLRPGPGVDRIENIERLRFPDHSVGTLLSVDALEHVQKPWEVAKEAHRVLAPNGVAVFLSCLNFKIHHHPDDYWRFTPSAFELLFRPFAVRMIGSQGAPDFPHTVFAILMKQPPEQGPEVLCETIRESLTHQCRLPIPWTKKLKWFAGEWLFDKRHFRRARCSQQIRIQLSV